MDNMVQSIIFSQLIPPKPPLSHELNFGVEILFLTSTASDLKALSNIGILKKLNTTSPLISGGNDENQDRLGVF